MSGEQECRSLAGWGCTWLWECGCRVNFTLHKGYDSMDTCQAGFRE